jgi:hypothetical protein
MRTPQFHASGTWNHSLPHIQVMYNNKRSPEAQKRRQDKADQHSEARRIQSDFGTYHDRLLVLGEDVNLMTPDEIIYYLGLSFEGVELSAVPETAIKGLVVGNKLLYQYISQAYNGGSKLLDS